jgi:dephospho-CoA kinase
VVHKLYAAGGAAVAPVGDAFPFAVVEGAINRPALSKCVVGNKASMKQLEGIVHPLVEQERAKFIQEVLERWYAVAATAFGSSSNSVLRRLASGFFLSCHTAAPMPCRG